MHILLTDILTCPRCGPAYGLILLADRIEDRRVIDGRLGCANCRSTYTIESGVANLAIDDAAGLATDAADAAEMAPSEEAAVRLAALMGLTQTSRYALIAGPAAVHAGLVAALMPSLEVITIGAAPSIAGTNRIIIDDALPFASRRVAGVALTGVSAASLLEEAARILSPVGRLLLEPSPPGADDRLDAAGLRRIAGDETTAVAAVVP